MTSAKKHLRSALAIAGVAIVATACNRTPEATRDPEGAGTPATAYPPASAQSTPPMVAARGVKIRKAPAGSDVAGIVRTEAEAARALGRDLVVYVGATWCEPCQRFHEAAKAGSLDDAFPTLTLLEFDLDEDKERLAAAGYRSSLIPLFVRPAEDGRATDKRFEGSVKGDGAVTNITPRLRAILAR